jgi:glycosyltransferase involved in cell wall biosynthesis
MMSGLPVVSTRHAGIGEIIESGRTGLLVNERDVAGMGFAMTELAGDPLLAKMFGRAAREDALKKYTADIYIKALENILESVCRL